MRTGLMVAPERRRSWLSENEISSLSRDRLADQQINVSQWVSKEMRDSGWGTNDGEPRILLLHVPKTGGTSLRKMLQAHVSSKLTFLSTGHHQWLDRSPSELSRYKLFVGHNFLEPVYVLPELRWITVLPVRDPMSWWQSFYKFRRGQVASDWREDRITELTFDEWVSSQADQRLSNPQSSWLLTRIRIMFDSPFVPQGVIASSINGADVKGSALVDLLERMIGSVTVLGVTDDLYSIYMDVCQEAGWTPRFNEAVRSNVTEAASDDLHLSPDQEKRLRSLNGLDALMYSWALDRTPSDREQQAQ